MYRAIPFALRINSKQGALTTLATPFEPSQSKTTMSWPSTSGCHAYEELFIDIQPNATNEGIKDYIMCTCLPVAMKGCFPSPLWTSFSIAPKRGRWPLLCACTHTFKHTNCYQLTSSTYWLECVSLALPTICLTYDYFF